MNYTIKKCSDCEDNKKVEKRNPKLKAWSKARYV